MYTLDGITIEAKRTKSGIGYCKWGTGNNFIVFLHGNGERGDGSPDQLKKVLNQGPFSRNGWQSYSWTYPEIFNYTDFTILYPQLPYDRANWDIAYIDQFLDEVHFGQPLMLMGWSLGGGGVLRYANQINPKHKLTMFVGIASYQPGTGENVKAPYYFAHATNDSKADISHTNDYVAKIPNFDPSRYLISTSGDHWGGLKICDPSFGIYDEFLTYAEPPEEIIGTIIKRGSSIFGIFNGEEILIK